MRAFLRLICISLCLFSYLKTGITNINPLNAELNPIRHLLALVGARRIVHVSWIRAKSRPPFASIGRSSPYCPR